MKTSLARRLVRAGAAGVLLASVGVGGVGFADTPSNWEDSPSVSAFQFILVLFLIPLGLAVVITVLSALSSMTKQAPGNELLSAEPDETRLDANQH